MQVHVLASGSTGNAVFLNFGETKILVDAGISTRRIKQGLAAIGTDIANLDAVLVTHEHRDHVSGLATLTKKYRVPVYASHATLEAMYCRSVMPEECCCTLDVSLDIGAVKIEPFSISHDAADPVGFNLFKDNIKCSVATDLGFATDSVKKALSLSDVMVLEANHDVDMLQNGSYPWYLKKRILSNRGHLSNNDAGWLLARLARRNRTKVMLAHLSQENNRPDLAETTVSAILEEQQCRQDIELMMTYPDRIASVNLNEEGENCD
ncbi:putative metallo-hydrolase YycJ [bioreactor metagenome]|uniref:Putative metallo-hydrolase YycJ n=1 Tax=bioreactor metagenome TaxID=1076179 RepID=A0A644SW15_9ZZZZ|nr:MBL fold metallo-hydrolase [Negativicutes bacterium]